ncbi:MAG: LptF/LptG family permease [Flavobacteriaceae bacterium]|nr:LptF/LptG family permease [Flavobacteriaceae bacterium]
MLKKYLGSFFFVLIILIPVIIAVDISEKIDRFLRHADLTVGAIIQEYYVNFMINIANMVLPLALFISVLFFTSKLAGNTEIIAIHNAKISFTRFLKPYLIGATIVTTLSLMLNHFIVPQSSKVFTEFSNKYIKKKRINLQIVNNANLQLSSNEYIYIRSFNMSRKSGNDFSYEKYEGTILKEKLTADRITFKEKDTSYRLTNFYRRKVGAENDIIEYGRRMDTIFDFEPSDLLQIESFAKEMRTPELMEYIDKSKKRGRGNLNTYLVELHKRTSLPMSSYILTLIAVILGSVKRRGGVGVNLTIGISLMFVYIFMLKIVEVLGGSADASPLFLVWLPNMIFGILAIYLYWKARE